MLNQWPTVVAGFPEMWNPVYRKFEGFFKAALNLESLHKRVFETPVSEEAPRLVGQIVKVMFNDFGAVLTLVLNGYGVQAMKLARSMFEAECNVHYLCNHPEAVRDYIDFQAINQKRHYDLLDEEQQSKHGPAEASRINAEYAAVATRFVNKRGVLRNSWCDVSIYQRAQAAGLEYLYQTSYKLASSMHHSDVGAIVSAFDAKSEDVGVAPSLEWLKEALVDVHASLVRSLDYYVKFANIGFEKEIQGLCDEYVAALKNLD